MKILVTGGAGYIGSHTIIELIADNHEVVIVDNLSNSCIESVKRTEKITNKTIPFFQTDLCDYDDLEKIFSSIKFDAVIHFAGMKVVSESIHNPVKYYENNLLSTLNLLKLMKKYSVKKLLFSSSAAIYGPAKILPVTEESPTGIGITNPYGQTKFMIEQILRDVHISDSEMEIVALRYFNPVGAHESGLIGEKPNEIPTNILPYISQVAVGKLKEVSVFGDDFETPDGTGVRDYIHVVDLAKGHVAAIDQIKPGFTAYNLGTGKGTSVIELIGYFEKAANKKIPYVIKPRRSGDMAASCASAKKAEKELGWTAKKTIEEACADSWRWQSQNPNGFKS